MIALDPLRALNNPTQEDVKISLIRRYKSGQLARPYTAHNHVTTRAKLAENRANRIQDGLIPIKRGGDAWLWAYVLEPIEVDGRQWLAAFDGRHTLVVGHVA